MSKTRPLSLVLGANGKLDVQTLIATVALGLVEAIRQHRLSPADAADLFFVRGFLLFGDSATLDPRLVKALHEGSELEDVARLAPRGLPAALEVIRENALSILSPREKVERGPVKKCWIR